MTERTIEVDTPQIIHQHRRKKFLYRRLRHRFKERWRKHKGLICAIIIAIFTAFWLMPSLIRFMTGSD